ncbi:unnamed protein product, partial [Phaeothamnion confervicola]
TVVSVVVVRKSQFEAYRIAFGKSHIILALPATMKIAQDDAAGVTAAAGGIGFARRFIQRFAHEKELRWVWMLDDNVQICYEVNVKSDGKELVPCSFDRVMTAMERLVDPHDLESHKLLKRRQQQKGGGINQRQPPASEAASDLCLKDYVGSSDCGKEYGIIGINRDPVRLQRDCQEEIQKPFLASYSVYSFCYLNVAATCAAGVLYPCKQWAEDVEFNHLVDEAGLRVCKVNLFCHAKKNLQ